MFQEVHIHALAPLVDPASLRGGVAVVIDLLRASTTITTALASGAERVVPCLTVEDALAERAKLPAGTTVLGGERHGLLIEGFDLANSPDEYTPQRVRGKTVIFTTTNGTTAVLRCREATCIYMGCLNALPALVDALKSDSRAIHLVCAGTRGEVSDEDVLCAGAIAEGLAQHGLAAHESADSNAARSLWQQATSATEGVLSAMIASRGGQDLTRIGMTRDIGRCARIGTTSVVAQYDARATSFIPH